MDSCHKMKQTVVASRMKYFSKKKKSIEQVVMLIAHYRTLSVMNRKVTQRLNERVMENHIKDSWTIPYGDPRRAKRRHRKHFRIQLMSLTKLASFLRAENKATLFESLCVVHSGQDVLLTSWTSTGHRGNSRSLAIHQTPPPKQASPHTSTQTWMHTVTQSLNSFD